MDDNICLPKTNFFILFLLFMFLVFYLYYILFQDGASKQDAYRELMKEIAELQKQKVENQSAFDKLNSFSIKLQETKQQPFTSPDFITGNGPSRQYIHNYNDNQSWQSIGYLYDTENTRYPLYSRNLYPGNNNRKEYYIIDDSRNRIEIPFSTPNNKELYDGDAVVVPTVTGTLTAKIYDIQQYKYNPNL